jgi:hypothetical protein
MLCCGLLAALAAALIGLRRRFGTLSGRMLLAGLSMLVAVPALAFGLADGGHVSRADLIARSMQSLCGGWNASGAFLESRNRGRFAPKWRPL